MNCEECKAQLESFLNGKLSGKDAWRVREHLASCVPCFSALDEVDRTEVLPFMDEVVKPSEDLEERFRLRVQQHRLKQAATRRPAWRQAFPLSRRLAIVGMLAAALLLAIYLGSPRIASPPPEVATETSVDQNLPLLEDMDVIQNLDLIEDFDAIQNLSGTVSPPKPVRSPRP